MFRTVVGSSSLVLELLAYMCNRWKAAADAAAIQQPDKEAERRATDPELAYEARPLTGRTCQKKQHQVARTLQR